MLPARTIATTAALALAATVWVATTDTLGGFPAAVLTNNPDTAGSGQLAITNTYASTSCAATQTSVAPVACTSSALPATVPSTASSAATTSIANSGTFSAASLTARYRVGGCGPVQLANAVTGTKSGALLPRTGTTFVPSSGPVASSGSITLNGTSGYASSVAATTEPTTAGLLSNASYSIGVWFRTSSTSVSPIFGFGSNPLDVAGSNDRILYLDATGKIAFVADTGTNATTIPAIAAGASAYNDGNWHFAYVRLSVQSALAYTVTISVDGKTVGTPTGSLGALTGYSGYWHLGWSPVAGTSRYFAGSLSDFVVDDSGSAPAAPASNPTAYRWDATATEEWTLNDSGGAFDGTTVTGVLPSTTALPSSASDPCAYVDVTWAMSSPTAQALARQSLRAAVIASWQTVSANPGPAATQTATITLQRDATFNTYAVGLILYVPIESDYSVGARSWLAAFRWSAAAAGAASGTTVVVG